MNDRAAAESLFREERVRILAALIRVSGSFDLAEEALQEAFAAAVPAWKKDGEPRNPAAWITATAQRKLIDFARRARTRKNTQEALVYEPLSSAAEHEEEVALELFPDDRLRLIFTCCHPTLAPEAQIALTLRTLCGLSTAEIARAFLLTEPTLAQRLVRAKTKIREARIPYAVPRPEHLPERLKSVLAVVYLLFNEGYSATSGESLVRADLTAEAIRLGRMLQELMPEPEVLGLLALLLLQDSRRAARMDGAGALVLLEEQDRALWDRTQIAEGMGLIETALRVQRPGPYQLQAAVAALHSQAATADATDWPQIAALYGELVRLTPTPVVALNHAVAVAMARGVAEGLAHVDRLGALGGLDDYPLFHAARADLLRRSARPVEAAAAYERALALTTNTVEQEYLRRRLQALGRFFSATPVDFPDPPRRNG
jgi:RNA polymerase sigma-70 factor (ECF subfamily)